MSMDGVTSAEVGVAREGIVPKSDPARSRKYVPALGPRMHAVLWIVFLLAALLGATGIYLFALRWFEALQGRSYQTQFSLWMFLAHALGGVVVLVPYLPFGIVHWIGSRNRSNRRAIRLGIALFAAGLLVALTGIALIQLDGMPQLPTASFGRELVYWLHVALPLAAVALYVLHRKAGPKIRWRWGVAWGLAAVGFAAAMLAMHSHDPRKWHARGSPEGEQYFEPSKARTIDGNFLSADTLMMDSYCLQCHADVYKSHIHSAHRNSSFNNPAYRFSVRETRKRVGTRAARWCAGCHDPVPFFSGQFDDPEYDDVNHPTASVGVTCTVCHSITHVGSRSGNADYTIEEPIHYPFAQSTSPALQWLNQQLVKAKPEFHKKTFFKPFHRSEAFCSTCHKVGLPQEVNGYKEFLRGQNHADSFWLSGVSGHSARSFYYPPEAKSNCAACHMPLEPSKDFGARDFDGSGVAKVHNHTFVGANTGLAALLKFPGHEDAIRKHSAFLRGGPDGKSPPLRVDLFGLKVLHADRPVGGASAVGLIAEPFGLFAAASATTALRDRGVDAPLLDGEPLRPRLPRLVPGTSYLVEVVIRTLNVGHHFTQGTVDSNEVWVDFQAKTPRRQLGRSGSMDGGEDRGRVDPWSHFLNALVLDRHGNRIDRRNPQDIFTSLYDHQIPPGAAQAVHYRLDVPRDLQPGETIELSVRVRYRKFDQTYMALVHGDSPVPQLPIVDLCEDRVTLPVQGIGEDVPKQTSPIEPAWQRWNDYGIACFLEGGPDGKVGGELGQAERAFRRLLEPGFAAAKAAHAHGHLNLARVHLAYGGVERLEQARTHLEQARLCDPPAPWWTVAWFNGVVNLQNANFDEAIQHFRTILDPENQLPGRKLDFAGDFVVRNELGKALFWRSQQESDPAAKTRQLREAVRHFEQTLTLDPENVDAHEFLNKCWQRLAGDGPVPIDDGFAKNAGDPTLLESIRRLAQPMPRTERIVAARRIAEQTAAAAAQSPVDALLATRRELRRIGAADDDAWLRLAIQPALNAIDRRLLRIVPEWTQRFVSPDGPSSERDRAGTVLAAIIADLNDRPRRADVRPALLALASFPQPGMGVQTALVSLAERDILGGGIPPTRLLALQKVRASLAPLAMPKDGEPASPVVARVLSQLHLSLHGIFKPDENAQDHAVRIHRSRFPAADRASHSIVIYRLNERPVP